MLPHEEAALAFFIDLALAVAGGLAVCIVIGLFACIPFVLVWLAGLGQKAYTIEDARQELRRERNAREWKAWKAENLPKV